MLVGLGVVAVGYLIGSFMRGRSDGTNSVLETATSEIEILKGARSREVEARVELEGRLRDAREKCAQDIAKLAGIVEQLRNENAELRSLVMMEAVPPALQTVLQQVARDSALEQRVYLDEKLHPIEQGVARLLTTPRTGGT